MIPREMVKGSRGRSVFMLFVSSLAAITVSCDPARPAASVGSPAATASAASPTASAPQTSPPTAVPFDLSGTGDRDLTFQSVGAWNIRWSFDCASLGKTGEFTLRVDGAKGSTHQVGSGSGMQGNGTVSNRSEDGSFTLSIRSDCQWHITASDNPPP